MSDYLWDKTGEREEDVRQLEELLGQLRFQPRTFEVPATPPMPARRAPRALNALSWSRLAIAASLLLTLLAGAWLIATKQRTNEATQQAAKAIAPRTTETPEQTPERASQVNKDQLASASANSNRTALRKAQQQREVVEQINASNAMRHQRREFISVSQKRLAAPVRQLNARDLNAPRDEVAMTTQEREAMEKFLLAMRVTSEKLGYAERQVQGLNESPPQR